MSIRQNKTMAIVQHEASWDDARAVVHSLAPAGPTSSSPVSHCHGLTVAHDVIAQSDLPPFDASRVDGWAIAGSGPWKIQGHVLAGSASEIHLRSGECVHIATGAPLPSGTTAVLRDEDSHIDGETVRTISEVDELADLQDVRPKGYEATLGEVLISAGTRLTPALVGLCAAAGYDSLTVVTPPTVDVLIFGDELIQCGPSTASHVRDSLGPQLSEWITYLGGQVGTVTHVADTLEAHIDAIRNSSADIIVTTGGTAAGPVDFLHDAITQLGGTIAIDAVLVRPGYHQLFAQVNTKALIGLPGNPQSAVISLLSLASVYIDAWSGRPLIELNTHRVAVHYSAPNREIKMTLSHMTTAGLEPVEHTDSSMLRGFVEADGYAVIPPGGVTAGSFVRWIPLPT